MTELSDLAVKYFRQLDSVNDLRRTAEIATVNMERNQRELDVTTKQLKDILSRTRPSVLIPIGFNRYVLVHTTNGSFGVYSSIDIIEESK